MTKKSSTANYKEITYPISIQGYVKEWDSLWYPYRELRSNCIDTGESYDIYKEGNNLVFSDKGNGLAIKNLLLGVSEKAQGINAIGQFGEGLKLALLVLTRMNKKVQILSGNLEITNDTTTIDGITVLKLNYRETSETISGTKITVFEWGNETYESRFITSDDSRIVEKGNYTTGYILKESGKIFVKTVFVTTDDNYHFGYNLNSINMNRDRSTVDDNEIRRGIGRIWESTNNVTLWKELIKAMESGCKEKDIAIYSYNTLESTKEAIKEAFTALHGKKAVLSTTDDTKREAEHWGANVIDSSKFGNSVASVLKESVGTDESYLIAKKGTRYDKITSHKLDDQQKKTFSYLRKLCKRINFDPKLLEAANLMATIQTAGIYEGATGKIKLEASLLYTPSEAVGVLIHELAHWKYGTDDMTEEHYKAIQSISGMLLWGYLSHEA